VLVTENLLNSRQERARGFKGKGFISMLAKWLRIFGRIAPGAELRPDGIPTVSFDASRVSEAVKADLRNNILLLRDVDEHHFDQVYEAALRSITAGRDLSVLYNALMRMNIAGMTKGRASDIAHLLNNNATALMTRERLDTLGIKQAVWRYSGAPCEINPKTPTGQDAAHRAANGKSFDVSKGMFLNGKWTWPGTEPGCRCVSKSCVPGFS
jgi:uncharacterized protein with gpF-like domain